MHLTKEVEETRIKENSRWMMNRAKHFVYTHPSMSASDTDDLYQIACQTLLLYMRSNPEVTDFRGDRRLSSQIQTQMYDYLSSMGTTVRLHRNLFRQEVSNFRAVPLEEAETCAECGMEHMTEVSIVLKDFLETLPENEQRALQKLVSGCNHYELIEMLKVNNAMGVSRKMRTYRERLHVLLELGGE